VSWAALGWAGKQRLKRAADKLVLIALADRHNEESDLSYPSVAWLADFCCLDRKTVIAAIDRLEALGLVADSGVRVGKTGQVKAYKLTFSGTLETVPKTEQFQKRNSSTFSKKQSQKRDTEPFLEPSPPIISSSDEMSPASVSAENDDSPLTVDELVEDWNALATQCGLPTVAKLTESRRRRAQARIRQYPELEAWQRAFACIRGSPWMQGQNERGWRADFDFILQDKSFTRLVEGTYGQA